MYCLVVIYNVRNKAYDFWCGSIKTAVETRDYINNNFLADKCYIQGMSKYKIKKALLEEQLS